MVFSSYLFIFGLLPIFLIAYKLVDSRFRNHLILIASLFFYYVGDPKGLWVLLAAIIGNYTIGYLIDLNLPEDNQKKSIGYAKLYLTFGVFFNLLLLGYFKYIGFLTSNINTLTSLWGHPATVSTISVMLPLGVSFFVFQGISYLVDIYRGTIKATHSLLVFATFKSLFPQLIAGPIVRYKDIATELPHRSITKEMIFQGVVRFVIGFNKKVLLADAFAVTADALFNLPSAELNFGTAWLGAVSYSLQIYFDFSAYSDMAIGLGLMMGFRFPENFNYPYTATSIRDFWRRWHMTLSRWFRDYVYIPLGGNQLGTVRTYFNLFAVFILTGLWHGASWTFVVWGLWHGFFMAFERLTDFERRVKFAPIRWAYMLGVVVFGWVLFRADTFVYALHTSAIMLGLYSGPENYPVAEYWDNAFAIAVISGMLLSFPIYDWSKNQLSSPWRLILGTCVLGSFFILASMKVLSGAYSPFLYFRF